MIEDKCFLINFRLDAWWTYTSNREVAPYAYHHLHNFTKDVESFRQKLASTAFVGNADDPEAGLDALMQAIACSGIYPYVIKYLFQTNMLYSMVLFSNNSEYVYISIIQTGIINWRQNAAKTIIYLTDADVHRAGDGSAARCLTKNTCRQTPITTDAGNK